MATSVLARTVVLSLLSIAGQSKATVVTDNQLSITPSKDVLQLGDNLTLSCRGLSDTDEYKITWKFNHEVIKGGNTRYTVLSFQDTDMEGANSILQISNIQPPDQGTYTCYGLGTTGGTAANYEMDLGLAPAMYMIYSDKKYSSTYQGLSAQIGEDLTIICDIVGKAAAALTWSFTGLDGRSLYAGDFIKAFEETGVHTMKTENTTGRYMLIRISGLSLYQSGTYFCNRDKYRQTNMSLAVLGATCECLPESQEVKFRSHATISCVIQSNPQAESERDLQWALGTSNGKNRQNIDTADSEKYDTDFVKKVDSITSIANLTIGNINAIDEVTYILRIFSGQCHSTLKVLRDEGMCRESVECGPVKICDDDHCVCPLGAVSTQNGSCINSETQGRPTKCKPECGKWKTCNNGKCVCLPGYVPSVNDAMSCNKIWKPKGDSDEEIDERYPGSSGQNDDKKENDRVIVVNHTSVAAIVGSTMGALAMILLVIVGYICYRRKKKSQKLVRQGTNPYRDPNYLYQYEYHSEANLIKDNPTFSNPGYQVPPPKPSLRKENTYISMKRDELEFPREQLQLGVDLGEGRFGKVIQARAMNIAGTGDWERVAVKTCRGLATDSEKEDLYQELEIMRKLPNHQNIVSLFGCCSRTDPLYIIMEYVQRGSLLSYIRKCRPSSRMSRGSMGSSVTTSYSSFMEPRAKDLTIFALQIARGMAHVASCGIIHRDLAARNILLATDFTCKICDFGLARDVEGIDVYERTSKGPLPIRWMAPESLADNMFTRKSDVWSYGVLLWEIVTLGATPYPGKSAMEVMRQVLQGYLLQRPLHCKEEMYELMLRCWTKEEERPRFADIVTHHEALMDDDYIILDDYDEDDYGWLENYTMDERV